MIRIEARDLIMPYFVIEGKNKRQPVASMPGIARLSVDNLLQEVAKAKISGVDKVLLFGVCPAAGKDQNGSYGYSAGGPVQQAVAQLKRRIKGVTVLTDVCLCAYTSHGHCGILKGGQPVIDSAQTLKTLAKIAVSHAEAGADWVAPSAMAKRQVLAIRKALDAEGFKKTKILGYSAKFASNFFAPFRDAAGSAPQFGDRRGYQLDYADKGVALREIASDIKEGADMVMVKPALAYLDIIYRAKQEFKFPLAAYNVSGEYALVKGQGSRVNSEKQERGLILEVLTGIKRAGADWIISYHANDIARQLRDVGEV